MTRRTKHAKDLIWDFVIYCSALFVVFLFMGLVCCGGGSELSDDDDATGVVTVATPEAPPSEEYIVQNGDSLWMISLSEQVDWLRLAATNRTYLVAMYDVRCTELLERRGGRKHGWYCNDRRRDAWANSLKPGDRLRIPQPMPIEAPPEIAEMIRAVESAPEPIAVVVDDTGSMSNDRQVVMDWYLAIASSKNKEVIGVWLYADGNVEFLNPRGTVTLTTEGSVENTFAALSQAAHSHPRPSSILLVTDEQGDDWDWSKVGRFPPVYGHCLSDQGVFGCEENLRRVARETQGEYIRGSSSR